MILQIMSDIKYFLIVLAIALTGFALAFWVISYPDHTLTFGSIPSAFLNTYQYMLGQGITADFEGTASPELGVVLLVMFMLFMMILMLNLLIALMGDSFSTIKSRGHAHWRREQASIILEQYSMVSEKTRNKVEENCHIHILKYFALTHDDELTDKQLLLSVKKTLDSRETEFELRGKIASLENKMDLLLALLSKKEGGADAEKEKQKTSEPSAAADREKAKE
jgi:predicted permease